MTTAELIEQALNEGIAPEDLDEDVHEAAASMAANINNAGLDEQISFLVERRGEQEVERLIAERTDRRMAS